MTGAVTGITIGAVYTLISLSFQLIVATTGLFNFALVSLVSIGGIACYELLNNWHQTVVVAVLATVALGGLLGYITDLLIRRPFQKQTIDIRLPVLLSSIGISIAIDALDSKFFGTSPRQVQPYVSAKVIIVGNVSIEPSYIVMIVVAVLIVVGLELTMVFTRLGRHLVFTQQDRIGAQLLGINVARLTSLVFAFSGSLACLAGFLVTPISLASTSTGSNLILPVFAAAAAGGFGSFRGAVVGALLVGLVSGIVPLYWSGETVNAILFFAIVLILTVRPGGIFGSVQERAF
jgi:branched-chain amino acid transport system permease protein